jgi:hypothetical protein
MKLKIFSAFLLLILLVPQVGLALVPAEGTTRNACSSAPPPPGSTSTPSLAKCVTQIYRWALGASAILALLMMIFGGYLVMTAGGNAQNSAKGKDYIMSAVVGMGLLFGAYIILNTINPDLVQLQDVGTYITPTAPRR